MFYDFRFLYLILGGGNLESLFIFFFFVFASCQNQKQNASIRNQIAFVREQSYIEIILRIFVEIGTEICLGIGKWIDH